MSVRALVVSGFGINCEDETAAAFRLAGGHSDVVHLNDIFAHKVLLSDYDIMALPGGFSFGDDLGSARALANRFKYRKASSGKPFFVELCQFIEQGGYVIGICNGFQVLVKMGLLPNLEGTAAQDVTLTNNLSGRFEDRWVKLKVAVNAESPFLHGLSEFELPVRHGEGRLVVRDTAVRQALVDEGLACLYYCDAEGRATDAYPENPNGSDLAIAALTDRRRRVFGIMPHPEAFLARCNHPHVSGLGWWDAENLDAGQGLLLFRNIVRHIEATGGGIR